MTRRFNALNPPLDRWTWGDTVVVIAIVTIGLIVVFALALHLFGIVTT